MERNRAVAALVALIILAGWSVGRSQGPSPDPARTRPAITALRDNTLEIWGSMGIPLSHASFKEFWMSGPGVSVGLMSRMTPNLKIGVGADATLFKFSGEAFAERYPGLPLTVRHQTLVHLYLFVRNYFTPGSRISPYLGAGLGFARISGAENKDVINGVRVTYYDIPGATRLSLGGVAGADCFLDDEFALQADIRGVYLHNDPNVGMFLFFRFGAKFKL